MSVKEYIFGGLTVIEIEEDEASTMEIYAINSQDYNPGGDSGRDPCGGATPCTVPYIT